MPCDGAGWQTRFLVAVGTSVPNTARLREATGRVARDPEFQRQSQAQFTEMDYLDGSAWRARLAASDREFRKLWQIKPWSEA